MRMDSVCHACTTVGYALVIILVYAYNVDMDSIYHNHRYVYNVDSTAYNVMHRVVCSANLNILIMQYWPSACPIVHIHVPHACHLM